MSAAKSVTLVNGQGVRVRVEERKVAGLKSTGFRRPGGRPAADTAKSTDTSK